MELEALRRGLVSKGPNASKAPNPEKSEPGSDLL